MREDIKLKKYRMLHKKVGEHYCNDFLNVKQSCELEEITPSTYYKICKTLNKRSVGAPKAETQSGGSKTEKKSNVNKLVVKKTRASTNNEENSIESQPKRRTKTMS